MNSFELVFSEIGDDVIIDRDYYNMKEEQCKNFHYISRGSKYKYEIEQIN